MGSISLPEYGQGHPKNEDTAYDNARQDKVDAENKAQRGSADADGTPALSASIAHLLVNKSALHAWHRHPRLNPNYVSEESAEFDYGRAAHAVLLEGSESSLHVIEADDWRTKLAKEAREAARAAGKTPMLFRQVHKVRAMVKAAQEYVESSELAGIFKDGDPEYSIKWREGETLCRSRLDWITTDRRTVLDYKTTVSANPHSFVSMAIGYGYAMQEAFYRRGVHAVHGKTPSFVFLLQEKEIPYACSLVAFDPAMQEMGDRQVEYALGLWATYMQRNEWPGYPKRIAHLEPPAWYAARAEEWATDEQLEDMIQP